MSEGFKNKDVVQDYFVSVSIHRYSDRDLRETQNCFSFEEATKISHDLYSRIRNEYKEPIKKTKVQIKRYWFKMKKSGAINYIQTINDWQSPSDCDILETEILAEKEF